MSPPPYELRLAIRYLRFHRGRTFLSIITLISVAGVAVGTAALVIALSLMTGFEEDVRQRILRGSAHLQILSSVEPTFSDTESLARRIESEPGIAAAGPVLFSQAMLVNEELGLAQGAEILGVDPNRQIRLVDLGDGGAEGLAALGAPGERERAGIVLGADLAKKLGVREGDSVRVLVPRVRLTPFAPIPRSRLLEVVGSFRSDAYPQDATRAYADIEAVRRLLDAEGQASWIEVKLDSLGELARRKAELGRALGEGWVVIDLLEQNSDILKALNTEKVILFLAIGLIVVVAALNIVSTLILMVTDKIREIGTLTALGARPVGIATVFMAQGVVIGAVGTVLGLALGTVISWWADTYRIIKLDPDVYYITHVPFTTRPIDLVAVGIVVLLVSFSATLYPAWKAASLDPVDAIRYE